MEDEFQPQSEQGLRDLLHVIWRRKWAIPLCCLLVAGPVIVYIWEFQSPVYESTARVLLGLKTRHGKVFETPEFGAAYDARTELEIMRSEGILSRAMNVLDLAHASHSWLRHLKFEVAEGTQVMSMSARGATPELPRDLANALAEGYVEHRRRSRITEMNETLTWLREQLADAKVSLLQAEEQFQKFKKSNTLPSLDLVRETDIQRYQTLSEAYLQAQKLRLEAEAELRAFDEAKRKADPAPAEGERPGLPSAGAAKPSSSTAKPVEAPARADHAAAPEHPAASLEPDDSLSPAVQKLALTILEKEIELKARSQTLKDGHPIMRQLRQEIQSLRAEYEAAKAKSRDRRLAWLQRRLQALRQAETQAKRELDDWQNKVLTVTDVAVEYRILERQAQTARATYELIASKIRDLTMVSGAGDDTARILDQAPPGTLVDPRNGMKIALATFGAVIASLVLCFVLEGLDTTIRVPADVERHLGLPVVALIPTLPEREKRHERLERKKRKELLAAPSSGPQPSGARA
jgi:succinoglycan biosynthesis transport protein ExoP